MLVGGVRDHQTRCGEQDAWGRLFGRYGEIGFREIGGIAQSENALLGDLANQFNIAEVSTMSNAVPGAAWRLHIADLLSQSTTAPGKEIPNVGTDESALLGQPEKGMFTDHPPNISTPLKEEDGNRAGLPAVTPSPVCRPSSDMGDSTTSSHGPNRLRVGGRRDRVVYNIREGSSDINPPEQVKIRHRFCEV